MGEYNRQPRAKRIIELQSCALFVFLEKGYRNTTMEDIVAASSLSKGGYHYYGSTKDILFDIMRRSNYDFIDVNIDTENGTTVEALCASLTESAVNRILEPTPARRLYLMFIDEMLYDRPRCQTTAFLQPFAQCNADLTKRFSGSSRVCTGGGGGCGKQGRSAGDSEHG